MTDHNIDRNKIPVKQNGVVKLKSNTMILESFLTRSINVFNISVICVYVVCSFTSFVLAIAAGTVPGPK